MPCSAAFGLDFGRSGSAIQGGEPTETPVVISRSAGDCLGHPEGQHAPLADILVVQGPGVSTDLADRQKPGKANEPDAEYDTSPRLGTFQPQPTTKPDLRDQSWEVAAWTTFKASIDNLIKEISGNSEVLQVESLLAAVVAWSLWLGSCRCRPAPLRASATYPDRLRWRVN
jgi:hypothetical protein